MEMVKQQFEKNDDNSTQGKFSETLNSTHFRTQTTRKIRTIRNMEEKDKESGERNTENCGLNAACSFVSCQFSFVVCVWSNDINIPTLQKSKPESIEMKIHVKCNWKSFGFQIPNQE
jgi:hypothetical protein